MSKTTFLGYVPSLKSKHEATIVGHKAIESKGGSIRYTLQGEYQGRKTLPKTVSKADFEGIYGFDAKEAEAVIIHGKKKMHPSVKTPLRTVVAHKIGVEDKDGFIPTYIDAGDFKDGITLSEGLFENHAESVLVVGRKDDGSQEVAGHVKGVADKEGFTPSKIQTYDDSIFDRQEIDVKSLKGNLVNHAETVVGNPSPASVEPPAPSEKPFPQEPSNENFSAEDYGWVITHKDSGLRTDSFRTKSQAEKYRDELKQNKTLRTGMKIVKANSNDEPITPNILNYLDVKEAEEAEFYQIEIKYNMEDGWEMLRVWKDEEEAISAYYDIRYEHPEVRLLGVDEDGDKDVIYIQRNYDLEVKEAFGFGKDEEEEKEEPKTQEFTVVLQEGDKLELTDVEEEQAAPDDEKTEKEAESPKTRTFIVSSVDYETDGEELDLPQDFTFTLDEHDTADLEGSTDMQEIADLLVDNISDETDLLVQGFYFQEKMPDGTLVDLDAETYEAVQAKVTRPVKEDETEDDEESEGLSTLAKVGLGVGALAVGAAIFGAEGEYPQEFLDEFYDFDSNPTADTQDEETLAIAYAAWLESKRNEENIPYQAETDYTEIYGAETTMTVEHKDGSKYRYSETDPIYGEMGGIVGHVSEIKDEKDTPYQKIYGRDVTRGHNFHLNHAETSNENFEAGNMMVKLQEVDGEAPYYNCPYCRNELTVLGGKGGIVAVCENESRCNGLEIPRQYLDDYEKYHWYVNERSSAENFSAEGDMKTCGNCGGESDADNFNECVYCSKQMCNQCGDYNGDCTNCGVAYCYDDSGCGDCGEVCKDCECDCNSMEAESKNLKMALGITAVGIGLAAVLGKEKIKTLFDRFGL